MNLEDALKTIEVLKKENKRLRSEVDYLEKMMYTEMENDYDEAYLNDGYDPRFD